MDVYEWQPPRLFFVVLKWIVSVVLSVRLLMAVTQTVLVVLTVDCISCFECTSINDSHPDCACGSYSG